MLVKMISTKNLGQGEKKNKKMYLAKNNLSPK